MLHDDIAGTRAKIVYKVPKRDPISVADIQGAGNRVPYQRKQAYDAMQYADVYDKGWQTKRTTNPLQPEYAVRDKIESGDFIKKEQTGLNCAYGKIERCAPQALPDARTGTRNLETQDIKGAQNGTKTIGAFTHYQRRPDQVRAVTENTDIHGSTCGSLRKSMHTVRITNPLAPCYQNPGAQREADVAAANKTNDPYGNQQKNAFADLKVVHIDGQSKRPSAMTAVKDETCYKAGGESAANSTQSQGSTFRHSVNCGNAIVTGGKTS